MKGLKFLALAAIVALPSCASVKDKVTNAYYNVKDYTVSSLPDGAPGATNQADRLVDKNACPEVQLVDDLASYYDFGGAQGSEANLVSGVNMTIGQTTCDFGPKSVAVDTQIIFNGRVGARGQSVGPNPFFSYPYFVAILAPGGKILAKEVFAAPLNFSGGTEQAHIESFRQIIPSYNQSSAGRHKIAVGFQLTKEQLAYNRALLKKRSSDAKAAQKAAIAQQKTITTNPSGQIIQTTTTTTAPGAVTAPVASDPLDAGPLLLAPPTEGDKKVND